MEAQDYKGIIETQIAFLKAKNLSEQKNDFNVIAFQCEKTGKNIYDCTNVIVSDEEFINIEKIIQSGVDTHNEDSELSFEEIHQLLVENYQCDIFFRPLQDNMNNCLFIFANKPDINELFQRALHNLFKNLLEKFKESKIDTDALKSEKLIADVLSFTSRNYINDKTSGCYNTIAKLSYHQYERKENKGYISFYSSNNKTDIPFSQNLTFDETNIRLIRKLIEGTDESTHLVVNNKKIVGYENSIKDNNVHVIFIGSHYWQFYDNVVFGDNCYLEYKNGFLEYKSKGINIIPVAEIREMFTQPNARKFFTKILEELTNEHKHGALFIITDKNNAQSESERLARANQCCKLNDTLSAPTINDIAPYISFSKIDGALMLDTELCCYAISCILDGKAEGHGNLARGSRYNSSMVYIADKKDSDVSFYAVILSDDGGIEILHNKSINTNFVKYEVNY